MPRCRKLRAGIGVAFALAAPLAAPAPAGARARPRLCGLRAKAPARYAHVIWIVLENKSPAAMLDSGQAPFLGDTARACGVATSYWAVAHPSLPNYIALTSGSTQGVRGDGPPTAHRLAARSLFEQVGSWKTYAESMPRACLRHDSYPYAVRHDPAAYYTRLRGQLCRRDVPMGDLRRGAFVRDLATRRLPRFSLLVPNLCNDAHDCSVATADAWLGRVISRIAQSRVYSAGRTAIFVTWDESDDFGGPNRVALVAIAPSIRPGTRVGRRLDHYALLRATEGMLGQRVALGAAAHAGRLRRIFGI